MKLTTKEMAKANKIIDQLRAAVSAENWDVADRAHSKIIKMLTGKHIEFDGYDCSLNAGSAHLCEHGITSMTVQGAY